MHMGEHALRARRTCGPRRTRGLAAVLTTLGVMALPAAAAQASATWTGAGTTPEWANAANWAGTPPAANKSAGTLTFPTLSGCVAPKTCYTSHNGLAGVSATGLVFANTSSSYHILQTNSPRLTVGTGGVRDTPGGGAGDVIYDPLTLSGPQTWSVGSTVNGYNSLTVLGGIAGPTTTVSVSVPRGDLFIDSDMETGPASVSGAGGLHIGGAPGSGHPGSVNGTDGQPLTINGSVLTANPSSTSGPVSLSGGTLQLGTNAQNNGTTTLSVHGTATLSSSTTFKTFINNNGSIPGTDFSQLSATGNITVGGRLVIGHGPVGGKCIALSAGDVATLVTTSGTLSGKFLNAAEGATLTLGNACPGTKVKIHYASTSVTATVV